ncbi:hypothetical protein HOLleu_20176 [Holothuria leucospilota]|uniref:Uncharacterized protein n=1 Tax=Holothuria leucospilota TaxID=206669 RepID=A0A9Q1H8I4_HOLLE|nr:hypothetical protein HOLleu_20176 [Holothuria leucospilota]
MFYTSVCAKLTGKCLYRNLRIKWKMPLKRFRIQLYLNLTNCIFLPILLGGTSRIFRWERGATEWSARVKCIKMQQTHGTTCENSVAACFLRIELMYTAEVRGIKLP